MNPHTYEWEGEGNLLARLEVSDGKMVLTVFDQDTLDQVTPMLKIQREHRIFDTIEGPCHLDGEFVFSIEGHYNWNARWRDLVTLLNEAIKTYGREVEMEE